MKVKLGLLLACLSIVACNELDGTLTLRRSINVLDKKGKTVALNNGSYRAEFEYDEGDREIKLEIKDAIEGKKDVEMKIRVPAGTQVPRGNGPIDLIGSEIGQNFDLHGDLQTVQTQTERQRGYESCTYSDREYICRQVCRDVGGGGRGRDGRGRRECRRECGYEYVTRTGSQDVEFHYVTTQVDVRAQLVDAKNGEAVGDLAVSRSDSQKYYDYQGVCRR